MKLLDFLKILPHMSKARLWTYNISMLRREPIAPGEYYHIYNRGVAKQTIFHDSKDYYRFLFLILYFQSPIVFKQLGRYVKQFVQSPALDIKEEVVKSRSVSLMAFCIMPNHFHLILKETDEKGIANYMQRVLTAYSKYYNKKYNKSGHVFQGPYQAVHVVQDRQLLHLSAYIHLNPRELKGWNGKEINYQWSSYQDCVKNNRWGELLLANEILGEFKTSAKYYNFVKTSPAKSINKSINKDF